MTQTLPEFREYSICQKCSHAHIYPFPPKIKYNKKGDKITRTCLNCGYTWTEQPADATPQVTPIPPKPKSRWKQIEVQNHLPPGETPSP
jgi:hypothetical protein